SMNIMAPASETTVSPGSRIISTNCISAPRISYSISCAGSAIAHSSSINLSARDKLRDTVADGAGADSHFSDSEAGQFTGDLCNGGINGVGGDLLAKVAKHHRAGIDAGERINHILVGELWRGAPDRFEHRDAALVRINVAGSGDAEPALDDRAHVGDD